MGVDDCRCRIVGCGQGGAAVKAEPADPEHCRTGDGQGRAVRHHHRFRPAGALAHHDRNDQRGDASCGVHHDPASKIQNAEAAEPAATPYPVCHRRIDDEGPERTKGDDPAKARALDPGADHQRGGDDGKGHLEQNEARFRNEGRLPDIAKIGEHPVHAIAEKTVGHAAKGERVAHHDPQQGTDTDDCHALDQHRQKILGAHQAAIEKCEPWQGHEQDQRAGGQNPGRVAAIGDIGNGGIERLLRVQGGSQQGSGRRQSQGLD